MRILPPTVREPVRSCPPSNGACACAPTCLFCVRVCVCGRQPRFIVWGKLRHASGGHRTNCALRNATNQNQKHDGKVYATHAHTHATRHARVSCVCVCARRVFRPSISDGSFGRKNVAHTSLLPTSLSLSLSEREREKKSGLGSRVCRVSPRTIGLRLFAPGAFEACFEREPTHSFISLSLVERERDAGVGNKNQGYKEIDRKKERERESLSLSHIVPRKHDTKYLSYILRR